MIETFTFIMAVVAVGFMYIGRIFEHSRMPKSNTLTYHPDSCKFGLEKEPVEVVRGRKFR